MESSDKGNDDQVERIDSKVLALLDKRMSGETGLRWGDFWRSIGYNGRCGNDGFPVPGELVKHTRLQLQFSQQDLADLLGCDRTMVAKMETHNHGLDSLTTRRQLAQALEISPLALGLVGRGDIQKQVLYDPSLLKKSLKLDRAAYFRGEYSGGTTEVDETIAKIYAISKGIDHKDRDILEVLCHYYQLGIDVAREGLKYKTADRYAQNAFVIGEALNDKGLLASTALRYCTTLYTKGDLDGSMGYAEKALSYEKGISQTQASAVYTEICRPLSVKKDKRTEEVLKKAYKIMRSKIVEEDTTFNVQTLAFVQMRSAEVHINSGEYQEALDVLDLTNEKQKYQRRQCIIGKLQSRAYYDSGEYKHAAITAQSALEIAKEINSHIAIRDIREIYSQLSKSRAKDTLEVRQLGMGFQGV